MSKTFRLLALICFAAALCALAILLGGDAVHRLRESGVHRTAGAVALMAIGLAYASVHVKRGSSKRDIVKAALLGGAFFLWGAEQFLSPSRWVVAIDTIVITVFVVDLGLGVLDRLGPGKDRTE